MPKKLLSNGAVVYDNWQNIAHNEHLSAANLPAGRVIVSLDQWLKFKDLLSLRGNKKLGVLLEPGESVKCIQDDLDHFSVVAINFPVFTDGRGYSYARELRERFGFSGEIKAVGDVLIDQLFALKRCGFDSFVMRKEAEIDHANAYLSTFTFPYQGSADDPRPIWHR